MAHPRYGDTLKVIKSFKSCNFCGNSVFLRWRNKGEKSRLLKFSSSETDGFPVVSSRNALKPQERSLQLSSEQQPSGVLFRHGNGWWYRWGGAQHKGAKGLSFKLLGRRNIVQREKTVLRLYTVDWGVRGRRRQSRREEWWCDFCLS